MKSPIVIEGLPGIGNVGKIAIDFIIESIKAKKITTIHSSSFPHSVFVNEQNLIDLPAISLYHKKIKQQDYLFIAGDVQPLDERSCHEFCSLILGELSKYNVKEIITLGGIGMPRIPNSPKVYATGNSKEIMNLFNNKSINKNIFGTVGPIIGVTGLLIGLSKEYEMHAICLLAQTFGHPNYLGIKGARELLKVLDDKFKFNIDFKSLNDEIKDIEKEIKNKTQEMTRPTKLKPEQEVSYIG